jgi:superfamily II DNA or RNA helicase
MEPDTLIAGTRVQPRSYQERIVGKALDAFRARQLRSVLIDSPTGSGKTVMGLLIARGLQLALGIKVGWVAMRRNLLAQVQAENAAKGIGLEATYLSMFDRQPPTGLDLLVVDEAQHDAASSMAFLHQVIRPRFILGLTATPFRSDRVKLCFDTVLRDAGIAPLIQDGYLSRFHHYTLPTYTPETVAECYTHDPKRWGKTIAYFHTLAQCHQAAALLTRRGVRCTVVSGDSDREAQLEAFRAGAIDVLLNCLVLTEGFDCPDLESVFCRPSCKGVTIQMCGRVLRKHPDHPAKRIVQCLKTRWPFTRTAAAALQYTWVGGEWRSLQVNPHIHAVQGRTLHALAQIQVELPEFLRKRQAETRRRRREEVGEGV